MADKLSKCERYLLRVAIDGDLDTSSRPELHDSITGRHIGSLIIRGYLVSSTEDPAQYYATPKTMQLRQSQLKGGKEKDCT